MTAAENHAWHTSVHAAGVLVSNEPITDYCTVSDGVTQLDKKDSEYLGLLKIDALGLRTLGIIEDTGKADAETLYTLDLADQKAFDIVNDHKYAGIFQFEGAAQRRVAMQIPVDSFRKLDHITALARPGPLGGGAANTYINIVNGQDEPRYLDPSMEDYLGDTYGVVLYQEQVMRIVKEIGNFSWEDTGTIRKGMSASKGIEFFNQLEDQFVTGAKSRGIDEKVAVEIWKTIHSFGAWGMNASHTCSYAIISYWCAWMKANYPLEFAAALLRSAKDDEQTIEILREVSAEGVKYTPFDLEASGEDWRVSGDHLIGGFTNIKGIGPAKAKGLIERRDNGKLTPKDMKVLTESELKFQTLAEARELWGDYYDNPQHYNIAGRVKEFAELRDSENAVVICKLVKKVRRDENENIRIQRRGSEWKGQPLFLDAFVVDDSVSKPVTLRIKTPLWGAYGEKMADLAIDDTDWFLARGRWLLQFNMLICKKIRCLTNEEMFT